MVSPMPDKVWPLGAFMIISVSTKIAVGILQPRVFRFMPSVCRTEKGEAKESLLNVVGRQI